MSNYKQTETSGQLLSWFAMRQGIVDNPYNGTPLFTLYEVERTALDGALIREQSTGRSLSIAVQTPGIKIPYINPETYEQILGPDGNPVEGYYFTDEQFAGLVASAYIYAARLEDAKVLAASTAAIAAQEGATQEQIDAATAAQAAYDQMRAW
jgi:hypothetical protein